MPSWPIVSMGSATFVYSWPDDGQPPWHYLNLNLLRSISESLRLLGEGLTTAPTPAQKAQEPA